jgi:hypothetical protein
MSQVSVQHYSSRYPIQLPLLYWRRKSGARTRAGAGWTRELGEGGVTAELPERLEAETQLRVRIQTDRGPIEMEAKVAWIGASTPDVEHCYGLAFTQVPPDQLQALRDLLLPLSMVAHVGMRLAMELPVTCRLKSAGSPLLTGRTSEVSRGGMSVRLPQAVTPGTVLEVTLHSDNGPLSLEGAVVWAQPPDGQPSDALIDHGLRFTSPTWSVSLALGFLLAGRP